MTAAELMVIEALDGQLITNKLHIAPKIYDEFYVSDTRERYFKNGCNKPL